MEQFVGFYIPSCFMCLDWDRWEKQFSTRESSFGRFWVSIVLVFAPIGVIWMKSSTKILKSCSPWWLVWLKWSCSRVFCLAFMFLIELKCHWNWSIKRRPVSPTHWRPQTDILYNIWYYGFCKRCLFWLYISDLWPDWKLSPPW